jgi:hypothetical protein
MKYINSLYSKYYNEKYKVVGHLFQGRYHAEIIEDEVYALQISRYIHLNPVKAKMVNNPSMYAWSSYSVYLGSRRSDIVTVDKILVYFDNRELYREFVERQEEIPEELLLLEVPDPMNTMNKV